MTPETAASMSALLVSQHLATSAVNQQEIETATAELRQLLSSLTAESLTLPNEPQVDVALRPIRDFDADGLLLLIESNTPDPIASLDEMLGSIASFKALSDEALTACEGWANGNGDLGGELDAEYARAWAGFERRQRQEREQSEMIIRQYAAKGWPRPPGAMLYALAKSGEELRAQQIAASNAAALQALAEAMALFNQGLSALSAALGDVYRHSLAFARLALAAKTENQTTAREYANAAAATAEAKLQAYRVALDAAVLTAKFPMKAHKAKLQAAETNAHAVAEMLQRKIAVESMRLRALSDIAASSINGLDTKANVRVRTSLE